MTFRFLLRGLIAASLAGMLGLLVLLRGEFEPDGVVELLRYAPYVVLVPPLALLCLLSWCVTWRWRGMALGALLILLVGVMDFRFGRAEPGSVPMRVMAYNIKSYLADQTRQGFDPIVEEIRRHDPDLVVMEDAQTINVRTDERLPPAFLNLQQGRHVFRQGQYAVMSRYPLSNCQPVNMSVTDELSEFLHCVVQSPVGDIDLYVTHFMTPRQGLNAARQHLLGLGEWEVNQAGRWLQARRLAGEVSEAKGPVIVAGDLNATDQSPVLGLLHQVGLRDAFSSAGWGWGYTHGHSLRLRMSFLRIDHILVSRHLAVKDSFVGGSEASEHRPIIADLWLRPSH